MNKQEKYEKELEALNTLRKEYETLGESIQRKYKAVQKLELELNQKHLDDIKWLIQNPHKEGQYEALRKWIKTRYGGEYNGVHPSGYRHNKDHSVSVQAFDFCLYNDHEIAKKNFKDFLEECLDYITPIDGHVIFDYGTGEYSGIHQLGYDVERGVWYTFVTRWGSAQNFKDHKSLDAALDYCIQTKPED
jgi:hypothetical protein